MQEKYKEPKCLSLQDTQRDSQWEGKCLLCVEQQEIKTIWATDDSSSLQTS